MDTSGAGKVLRASTVHTPSEDTANEVAPAVQRILETNDDSGNKTCRDADKDQYLCAQNKRESHRYHSVRARPRRAGNRNRPFSALPEPRTDFQNTDSLVSRTGAASVIMLGDATAQTPPQ